MLTKKFNSKWFEEPKYTKQEKILYKYKYKYYRLWYGRVGISKNYPLLVLHGGPGGSHSNLVSLQALGFEREIYFYDQLGCGNSDKPDERSLWNINRYTDELKTVVDTLGLTEFHLLGHSWGGMLATAFAHKYPDGIKSISLMSPILNMPLYINGTRLDLRRDMPADYTKIIDDFELYGKGDFEIYKKGLLEHLKRNICKSFPNPPAPLTRLSHLRYKQVHDEMIGLNCESELNILGNLKNVDVSGYIKVLNIPLLFTCGDYECCPPGDLKTYVDQNTKSEFHVFVGSRHMTMLDSPLEFLNVTRKFLIKYD